MSLAPAFVRPLALTTKPLDFGWSVIDMEKTLPGHFAEHHRDLLQLC
jgi:hypothetical protein